MNKFQQLIETLQTELIILIDDDFTPVNDIQDLLTYICIINRVDRDLMLQRLETIDNTLIDPIKVIIQGFEEIEIQLEDEEYLNAGLLSNLLKNKEENDLLGQVTELTKAIESSDHKEDIFNLSMMYGLRQSAGTESYNGFFEGLKEFNPKKSIRLYKGLEGSEFSSFEEEIRTVNELRNNKFPLLIVDKYLANTQNGNEIIAALREGNNGIDKFFSVLYTSQDDEQITPSTLQNYFHIQLKKGDELAVEKVSEALALSAFATFFDQIYSYRKEALHSANRLVINSGIENMIYLAGMAHAEGDTVFNIFNNWFDLLSEKKVEDELLKDDPEGFDLNFMVSLTTLINSDFISIINENRELDENFHKEIKQLSTFEIFSYHCNRLCSPPSPGDIYNINGELYMLAGQECDLVVRKKGRYVKRNEKLAELIKCSFKKNQQNSKVNSTEDKIAINHFEYENSKGILEIFLGMKEFIDFRLLDLCCLNLNGESKYSSEEFPTREIITLLPDKWEQYIPGLIDELNNKILIQQFIIEQGIEPNTLTGDYSFNTPHVKNGNSVVFPIKRIGRIKGHFREYVMQQYYQYKTRRGLNTIGLYKRHQVKINSLKAGFQFNLQEVNGDHYAWIQLTGDREKNKKKPKLDLVISKQDLVTAIDDDLKPLMEGIEDSEIIIPSKDDFTMSKIVISKYWKNDELSIEVIFPIFNEYADFMIKNNDRYSLFDLFGKEFIKSKPSLKKAYFISDVVATPMMGERGKLLYIKKEELVHGDIYLPEEKIMLKLNQDNGRLLNVDEMNQEEDEHE